jgi:hypothetical protein
VEEFYHPEKYKTKFCASYPDKVDSCEYGDYCAFAHHESELTITLLDKIDRDTDFYLFHFKTVWCPFSDKDHLRDQCVYAHNWQDYRRPPHLYDYQPQQCPGWETKKNIKTYRDGCRWEYRCGLCHGWKELEYHPSVFRTSECRPQNGTKCKKSHCPYYHSADERRYTPGSGSFFKFFPKNRGFTNGQVYQY